MRQIWWRNFQNVSWAMLLTYEGFPPSNILEHHTCHCSLICMLCRDARAMKSVEGSDDPKGHLRCAPVFSPELHRVTSLGVYVGQDRGRGVKHYVWSVLGLNAAVLHCLQDVNLHLNAFPVQGSESEAHYVLCVCSTLFQLVTQWWLVLSAQIIHRSQPFTIRAGDYPLVVDKSSAEPFQ